MKVFITKLDSPVLVYLVMTCATIQAGSRRTLVYINLAVTSLVPRNTLTNMAGSLRMARSVMQTQVLNMYT